MNKSINLDVAHNLTPAENFKKLAEKTVLYTPRTSQEELEEGQ